MKPIFMKYLLFTIALFFSITIFSQSDRGTSNIGDGYASKKGNVKGHPYLFQNWGSGYLIDSNGKLSEEKLLNYDILNHNLTYKVNTSSEEIFVINGDQYPSFIVTDSKKTDFSFAKIKGSDFQKAKKVDKYYQLVNGNSNLVILESLKILKDPNASGWSSSSLSTKSAEYNLNTTIYILNDSEQYVKVKANKSSILKALKDKKKEIDAYLNDNNTKIKTESDLVSILEYYHSLNM